MQGREFVSRVAKKSNMKIKDVEAVLNGFVAAIEDAFNADERVELRGFGNFVKKARKARKGFDFNANSIIDVPAKEVLTFKQSSLFNKKR